MDKLKRKLLPVLILICLSNAVLLGILIAFQLTNQPIIMKANDNYPELSYVNNKSLSFQALTDFFTQLARKKGADYSYEALKVASLPSNTDFHLIAHSIGDILYKQKGSEGIAFCTDDFRNACSHSIVISLFREQGPIAINTISQICKEAPGGKGAYTMCFHGLGHGVLAYTEYNMEEAIKLCEKTGTEEYSQREYIECVGGVTMEMVQGVHDVDQWKTSFAKYFNYSDPLAPCSKDFIPNITRSQCYFYLTPHLFITAGADGVKLTSEQIEKAFTFCKKIPASDVESRKRCFAGFGKEFIVLIQNRDIRHMDKLTTKQLARINEWCQLANENQAIESCLIQAVNSLYWGGANHWNTPIALCKITRKQLQDACFHSMIANVNFYNDDVNYRNTFCNSLPKNYRHACESSLLKSKG